MGFFYSFKHTNTLMLLHARPPFIQQWWFDHSPACCSALLWAPGKCLSLGFCLLPTCVGSHGSGEEKNTLMETLLCVYVSSVVWSFSSRQCLGWAQFRWLQGAVLILNVTQHKPKPCLNPKCFLAAALAGRGAGTWRDLTLLPSLHLVCCRSCGGFVAGPLFVAW